MGQKAQSVTTNIYRSAVPAQKYLPERRSAAFRHHYTPAQKGVA